MQKDTLIFKNEARLTLESGASLGNIRVISDSKESMLYDWNLFTEENLSEVRIETGSGLAIGTYHDLILESETSSVLSDSTISTIYSLREKTAIEKRLDALTHEQDIQNEAIEDLGAITSTLAGDTEGGLY